MHLDIELCMMYMYSNESFWTKVEVITNGLLNDSAFGEFFNTFQMHLCVHHNVEAASDVYNSSLKYIRLFYPQTVDFYPAVLLGLCLPTTVNQFKDNGIEDQVIQDTLMDFGIWAREYEHRYGRQGIGEVSWIFMPHAQKIFRLGRLQFELTNFEEPYFIYKHKGNGQHIAFAAPGYLIDEMGNLLEDEGKKPTFIKTTLIQNNNTLTGYPADFQQATIYLKAKQIDLNEWTLALYPGRRVLNIHIPAEEPLDSKKVDDSFAYAKHFFAQMGYPVDYGMCFSWLLDTHLQDIAEKDSNIVLFMHRFYKLSSAWPHHPSIAERVFGFGFPKDQLASYEPKSRLQRSLKAYLLNGGVVADMAGFVVIDD